MVSPSSSLVHTVWREIFEVDLVADAGAGRHDAEIAERLLAPFQEFVALLVALVFELDVAGEGHRRAELVDDDRVVDDEVDRHQRIDLLRIAAERRHGVAHGGEIDDGRNAGEILHQHARRAVGDLDAGRALVGEPAGDRLDAFLGDRAAVLVAQQVLEQHLHRIGQLGDAGQPVLLGLDQAEIDILGAADGERPAAIEAVERFWHVRSLTVGCRTGNERQWHAITRKGAGAVISAVRSLRSSAGQAGGALVSAQIRLPRRPLAWLVRHIENFVE